MVGRQSWFSWNETWHWHRGLLAISRRISQILETLIEPAHFIFHLVPPTVIRFPGPSERGAFLDQPEIHATTYYRIREESSSST